MDHSQNIQSCTCTPQHVDETDNQINLRRLLFFFEYPRSGWPADQMTTFKYCICDFLSEWLFLSQKYVLKKQNIDSAFQVWWNPQQN